MRLRKVGWWRISSSGEIVPLVLAALPALLLTSWWHLSNYDLPTADAAAYLGTSQSISQAFDLDGIGAGLMALYLDRGWRPTLYPALTVPFHWIGKSDLLVVVSGTSILFTALLCYWTYRCFRVVLSPWRAVLATACCTTASFRLFFSFNFFSELPLLAFSLGAAAHLINSRLFQERRQVRLFALLLTLAVCVRPVEPVIAFGPVVLFAVWLGFRRGVVGWHDVTISAGLVIGTAAALLSQQFFPPLNIRQLSDPVVCLSMLGFLGAGLGAILLWRPRPLVEGTCLLAVLIVFWWLPSVRELFGWLIGTTVGGIIQVWPTSHDPWAVLAALVHSFGIIQFTLFAGIFPYLLYERIVNRQHVVPAGDERWLVLAALPLALVTTLLPSFALGQANDPRRLLLGTALTSISMLSIVLRPNVLWTRPFVAAVAEIIPLQVVFVLILITGFFVKTPIHLGYPVISVMELFMFRPPYTIAPGPDQKSFAVLNSFVPKGSGVILIGGAGRQLRPPGLLLPGSFNDYALNVLMQRRPSLRWSRIPDWSKPYDRFLNESYDLGAPYILLGNSEPVVENPAVPWQLQDAVDYALARQQLLSRYDLREVARAAVPERGILVLLKLIPRDGIHNWSVYPIIGADEGQSPGQFIDDRHARAAAGSSSGRAPPREWRSSQVGDEIAGNAWLGYAFSTPQSVREIRIRQSVHDRRQDLLRVEKSLDDGATWTDVAPAPFRLAASDETSIVLPDGPPARYWRVVAAGHEITQKPRPTADDWRITGLEFLVPQREGLPIGSGAVDPERAVSDDPAVSWVSPEQGRDIKGRAWIGYAFETPQTVRSIQFAQEKGERYRQGRVMVQSSNDGGLSWQNVLRAPATVPNEIPNRIDMPAVPAARDWRLVAADDDNAAAPKEIWAVRDLEFFVSPNRQESPADVAVSLDGGSPISSGNGSDNPAKAFRDDTTTYWYSPEHGEAIKDRAWIGYAFATPKAIREIRIGQATNPLYRQSLVRVEKSVDGGATWQAVAAKPFPMMGSLSEIHLPAGEPARLWRVVAASDGAAGESNSWAVERLAFYSSADEAKSPMLTALPDNVAGSPIASGDADASVPGRAFDGDPATYWFSAERGSAVKDHAWIGYAFVEPREVRQIHIEQPPNPLYRQDRVQVEKSLDGGATWQPVLPTPTQLTGASGEIDLPAGAPARLWRLAAVSDNQKTDQEAWAVQTIRFYVPTAQMQSSILTALPGDGAGVPITSGAAYASAPERAFDGDPATYWLSAEHGAAVKDHAWIGYAFDSPWEVRDIHVEQPPKRQYRQDLVRVEKSVDGGATWQPAAPAPIRLTGAASEIELPAGPPARLWRLMAASGNQQGDTDAWAVGTLRFYAPTEQMRTPLLTALSRDAGVPIAGGGEVGNPARAFDDDGSAYWFSVERGGAVKDHAWIGYAFEVPWEVRQIHIQQPANSSYRQDLVRIEKSLDGGATWQPAAPGPVRLTGTASEIDLPPGAPARLWRIVAAGDNQKGPSDAWAIQGVRFYVPTAEARAPVLTPLPDNIAGAPIASGTANTSAPERAVDGDPATYWLSAERGAAVKDHAWIGYAFTTPWHVRQIHIEQPPNPAYRQDLVRVEKSIDGGATWVPALAGPVGLGGAASEIDLPPGEPARLWRLVAAGDNQKTEQDAWAVQTLRFYVPTEETKTPLLTALPINGSGTPIASSGAPEHAFGIGPVAYWFSGERAGAVKDHAWIGYAFAIPWQVRQIHIEQPPNPLYRQDLVRVEKSLDGGDTWLPVLPGPVRLNGTASEIDLPAGDPARLWRLVAAGDNQKSEADAWAVQKLTFYVSAEDARTPLLTALQPGAGTPIASGNGGGAERAFDGDPATFWLSPEHDGEVKDHAWIGSAFAIPWDVRQIHVEQPPNPFYRQDWVRVEKSMDGGATWQPARPGLIQLNGTSSQIDLPASEPARLWRLMAASDNQKSERDAWAVETLSFYSPTAEIRTPVLTALPKSAGMPVASGNNAGNPDKAFDGDTATFWFSAERGGGVKDQAWIGYAFAEPQIVRQIHIDQPPNPFYRQDLVRVEKSVDGETWEPVFPEPVRLSGPTSEIDLPAGAPARLWRLVAAADNAKDETHAWAVNELKFFAATPVEAKKPAD